jgi:hypothetical protein
MLAEDLGKMIRSKVKINITLGASDLTMITLLKDELTTSQLQAQHQLEMMKTQFIAFQNMLTSLQPLLNSPALNPTMAPVVLESNPQPTSDNKTPNSEYGLTLAAALMQPLELTTPPCLNQMCCIHMKEVDPNNIEYNCPGPTGLTQSPKQPISKQGMALQRKTQNDTSNDPNDLHSTTMREGTDGGEL